MSLLPFKQISPRNCLYNPLPILASYFPSTWHLLQSTDDLLFKISNDFHIDKSHEMKCLHLKLLNSFYQLTTFSERHSSPFVSPDFPFLTGHIHALLAFPPLKIRVPRIYSWDCCSSLSYFYS